MTVSSRVAQLALAVVWLLGAGAKCYYIPPLPFPLAARHSQGEADSTMEPVDKCATVRCAANYECAVVNERARCFLREACGLAFCAAGLTCCNPTCSTCMRPGEYCTMQVCN